MTPTHPPIMSISSITIAFSQLDPIDGVAMLVYVAMVIGEQVNVAAEHPLTTTAMAELLARLRTENDGLVAALAN